MNSEYATNFKRFVDRLKSESGILMSVNQIDDVEDWMGHGIMMMNAKKEIFEIAINRSSAEVIGFCNVVKNRNRYEIGVAVDIESRKQNIGARLMKKVLTEAKKINIISIYALVDVKNIASVALIKKNKFIFSGTEDKKDVYKRIL